MHINSIAEADLSPRISSQGISETCAIMQSLVVFEDRLDPLINTPA